MTEIEDFERSVLLATRRTLVMPLHFVVQAVYDIIIVLYCQVRFSDKKTSARKGDSFGF